MRIYKKESLNVGEKIWMVSVKENDAQINFTGPYVVLGTDIIDLYKLKYGDTYTYISKKSLGITNFPFNNFVQATQYLQVQALKSGYVQDGELSSDWSPRQTTREDDNTKPVGRIGIAPPMKARKENYHQSIGDNFPNPIKTLYDYFGQDIAESYLNGIECGEFILLRELDYETHRLLFEAIKYRNYRIPTIDNYTRNIWGLTYDEVSQYLNESDASLKNAIEEIRNNSRGLDAALSHMRYIYDFINPQSYNTEMMNNLDDEIGLRPSSSEYESVKNDISLDEISEAIESILNNIILQQKAVENPFLNTLLQYLKEFSVINPYSKYIQTIISCIMNIVCADEVDNPLHPQSTNDPTDTSF